MAQFAGYADYYDSVYLDKPYKKEVDIIESFFDKHLGKRPKTILSLGCGTGTYEIELAKRGYQVTGVDLSQDMLSQARIKIEKAGMTDRITLIQSDIRTVELSSNYDVAIMMFNIAGYLHTEKDMTQVAQIVGSHIPKGSIFLFDAWNGLAVEMDPPGSREKIVEKEGKKIIRKTTSKLDKVNKLVKITFSVNELGQDKEVVEQHPMRYWFNDELASSLSDGGLNLVEITSFHNPVEPVSDQEWDMFVVAKKA